MTALISKKLISRYQRILLPVVFMVGANMSFAAESQINFAQDAKAKGAQAALNTVKKLSNEIQQLKSEVVDLNKDLRLMEEELLFPTSTQATVFVSLDIGKFFTLESVKLKLDERQVATHLYSEKQRQSLARGGVQRLHMTNLNQGKHTLSAFFTGLGPNGRPYKRASELTFIKGKGSQYIELIIIDDLDKQEPNFVIKQW
ncbi:MAG: hypothetical protein ACI843_000932 [Psychrobacter glaciei]|jgi:hypothetical protein